MQANVFIEVISVQLYDETKHIMSTLYLHLTYRWSTPSPKIHRSTCKCALVVTSGWCVCKSNANANAHTAYFLRMTEHLK